MVLLFTRLPVLYVTSKSPLLPFVLVLAFCARGFPQISRILGHLLLHATQKLCVCALGMGGLHFIG